MSSPDLQSLSVKARDPEDLDKKVARAISLHLHLPAVIKPFEDALSTDILAELGRREPVDELERSVIEGFRTGQREDVGQIVKLSRLARIALAASRN